MASSNDALQIPTLLGNIPCQELLSECAHCGWLRKKPSLNLFGWNQAYVVLHDGCVYYYRNERYKSPSGKFSLYGYNSVFRASDVQSKEVPWAFKIVHSHREFKTYYFAASSEREMKVWMTNIKRELLRANGKNLTNTYIYGKPAAKEKEEEDDASFYQHVETNIYDDAAKFKLPTNYSSKYGVKKGDEDSDDEDLSNDAGPPKIDSRPPKPLPATPDLNRPPKPLPRPECARPKPNLPELPQIPPPETQNGSAQFGAKAQSQMIVSALEKQLKLKNGQTRSPSRSPVPGRRRGSYIDVERDNSEPRKLPGHEHKNLPKRSSDRVREMSADNGEIDLDDLENMDGEVYWSSIYFNEPDKQLAHDILLNIAEEGVYLVRPEERDPNRKVLVVYAENQVKKYRIQLSEDDEFYIQREGGYRNSSLEEMLAYYYDVALPTVNAFLTVPYKLHKKYQKLYGGENSRR